MTDARDADENYRLDKWLWAARFYKTRGLAAEAIAGGKVELNGDRAKRAKVVRVGDALRIRQGPYEHRVIVRALSARRGPAAQAAALYLETIASREAREQLAARLKTAPPASYFEKGRPTKKDRRELDRLKRRP